MEFDDVPRSGGEVISGDVDVRRLDGLIVPGGPRRKRGGDAERSVAGEPTRQGSDGYCRAALMKANPRPRQMARLAAVAIPGGADNILRAADSAHSYMGESPARMATPGTQLGHAEPRIGATGACCCDGVPEKQGQRQVLS